MRFPDRFPPCLAVLALLAAGCGVKYTPDPSAAPPSGVSAGTYPLRTDLLVIKLLDGAPRHWPAAGFPPLRSAQNPQSTPDRDIAEDLRKQFGKNVLDPARLSGSQTERLARLMDAAFGTPAEPRVRLPGWDEVVADALVRPEPSKGVFRNLRDVGKALKQWDGYKLTTQAVDDLELAGVPDAVLKLLAPVKSKNFATREEMASALAQIPEADQVARYRDLILSHAQKAWSVGPRADWESAVAARAALGLDPASLARGSVVYRRQCMQCHGPTGAGDGAHAIQLAAMPRDYRQGIFKFVTAFPTPGQPKKGLGASGKPRREDLKRTLRKGIDGSMMPAFPGLTEQELDDVVGYVIHLAVRGETEFATMAKAMQPTEVDPDFVGSELTWLFDQNLMWVLHNWGVAARSEIPVPPENVKTDEDRLLSAVRGYKLYNSAEFGCASCHVNYGRDQQLKWDLWGTVVQPRNLPLGVYRGGRRGEDLYARLYGGIYPSGMTAFHTALKTGPTYFDRPDKIWNVVHFLQALADPYSREKLQDPATLAKFKERLKADGDTFLDDLNGVRIEP